MKKTEFTTLKLFTGRLDIIFFCYSSIKSMVRLIHFIDFYSVGTYLKLFLFYLVLKIKSVM